LKVPPGDTQGSLNGNIVTVWQLLWKTWDFSDRGFGKLHHEREMAPIDKQTVIRMNRDTIYSFGLFDLDTGPLTLTLPDPGKRYMSVLLIDEDQYNPDMLYAPGTYTITKDNVGTRYVPWPSAHSPIRTTRPT